MDKNIPGNTQSLILKDKELAFALAYLELGPVKGRNSQAAVKAGYSAKTAAQSGSKMLKKAHVLAYIRAREAEMLQVMEEKYKVTRERITAMLLENYERCMQVKEVMTYDRVAKCMVGTGQYVYDGMTALRAAELLGKSIGMFSNKKISPEDELFNLMIDLGPPKEKKVEIEEANPEFRGFPVINLP